MLCNNPSRELEKWTFRYMDAGASQWLRSEKEWYKETRLRLHLLANVLDTSSRHGRGGGTGWIHRLIWMTSGLGVAHGGVVFMILEAVEVFVSFATDLAAVGFVLFHSKSTRIWTECLRIYDREGTIVVRR